MDNPILDTTEKNVLIKILDSFNSSTDLTAIIVNLEGNPIISNIENPLESCQFCKIIRRNSQARKRCSESYARAGKLAATIGEPYIFRCPAGLVEWATPILLDGKHLGTIICGQVLMWEPEDFFWIELTMMNKQFQVDMAELISAAQKLPVISGKKVQAAADLLFTIANEVITRDMITIEVTHQEEKHTNCYYSINKENELLKNIKSNNIEEALKIIHKILFKLKDLNNLEIIKFHLLEILILISRILTDKGANSDQIFELNFYYSKKISNMDSIEQIYKYFPLIFEQYISFTQKIQEKNSIIVNQAKEYIQLNYQKNLKLEDISQEIFLSPFYLSHIFKKETGSTVLEYITMIRIDKAKSILYNSQKSIKEVSQMTGYNNPSYFSKIFRNIVGITPTEYREKKASS